MEHGDLREIFERLEALERLARSRSGEHGGGEEDRRGGREEHHRGGRDRHDRDRHHGGHDRGGHDRGRGRGGDDFQEKRIVDTVVRLVGERVERVIQDQQARMQRRDDRGDERRVVELVVRLVGEQVREIVQEIVSTELDRRLGRPAGEHPSGNPPPRHPSGSEER